MVVFGSDEQKQRWLPPLIAGRDKACFAVTEPDTGLNTLKLKTRAVREGDHYVVSGQKVWISTAQVGEQDAAAGAHHAGRRGARQRRA